MIEIFHVSDLHFGKSDSQNRKANSLLDGISRQFPFKMTNNRYLLVTGDITNGGKKEEYTLAKDALSPFAGRVFVTPGNHDYGSHLGTDYKESKARYFDDPFATGIGFRHSFFDKKVFTHRLQDQFDQGSFMMIGLNSCAKKGESDFAQGEIGYDQRCLLAKELDKCDPQTPILLFLHHIPNKAAEWEFIMTLKDWEKLMAVVGDKVDVFAFGHQGKDMNINNNKNNESPKIRQMQVRSFEMDKREDSKTAIVLDANNSVAEQAFYRITLDGNKPTASVVSVVSD